MVARRVVLLLLLLLVLAGATTATGIHLLDSSSPASQHQDLTGQAVLDIGVAVLGGAVVGIVIATVQALIDEERESRFREEERAFAISMTLSTERDLQSIDLSGRVLDDRYLAGKDLRGANLGDTSLRRAVLNSADLRGCDLTGADLTGADLRYAKLDGADLTGAILTGVLLEGADPHSALSDSTTIWPEAFQTQQPTGND